MSNLPIQFIDKENSPALLAFMQQFGEHTYVDAELINKFRDALNELHARTADTRIVENTGLQIVGTDVVINELWKWLILSVLYSNDSQITLPITLSSEGNQKLCYLCANQDNGFELVYGPESETNPVAPTIPDNLLYITFFLVTDGTVGTPAEPIVGDIFKKKSESAGYSDPTLTGSDAVIPLQPNGQSVYAFSNAGLVSIEGFGLNLITGNPSAEVPYSGKDILIYNNKAGNLTLKHDGSGTADVKFFFIDETDLIIPSGGKVWLKYGSSYCEMIFKSWIDVDLSSKADLVGGKVPATQLPSYVDDVIEGYFNGTNFYTDALFTNLITPESSKIYINIAVTPATQYRWSGSAYVQIGGGGANKQIFQWWGGNWVISTLDDYFYIGASNSTISKAGPTGLDAASIAEAMNGRNKGLFTTPFNCKIKRVMFKEAGSGSYTGRFILASGLPVYNNTFNFAYTNVVTHLDEVITATGYEQRKNEYLVTDNITIPKGYVVSPILYFSAQAQTTKQGIEISIEIEEVV